MAQKRRGKMTRKQRQRQLHRRMFLTGVLVVLICVGIYSGIRRVAKTASDIRPLTIPVLIMRTTISPTGPALRRLMWSF